MTSRFACSGLDSREGRQRERERQGGEGQRHEEIELRSDDDHASRESPERLDKEFEGAPSCLAAGRCPPEDARAEPREPGERSRDLGRPAPWSRLLPLAPWRARGGPTSNFTGHGHRLSRRDVTDAVFYKPASWEETRPRPRGDGRARTDKGDHIKLYIHRVRVEQRV